MLTLKDLKRDEIPTASIDPNMPRPRRPLLVLRCSAWSANCSNRPGRHLYKVPTKEAIRLTVKSNGNRTAIALWKKNKCSDRETEEQGPWPKLLKNGDG